MTQARFEKSLPAFDLKIDIAVEQGILAVVGPSGAGKTTLLQCIAGLQKPTQGEITIGDQVVFSSAQKTNVPVKARCIGYLFQDYALFPHMTVKKNAMYGMPKGKNRERKNQTLSVLRVLEMLNIQHLKDRYPSQISGGEKQRTALARALMREPELLLLDEPLSALDKDTRGGLQQELRKLQKQWKIPFILVTHDLQEAEFLGDQIIRITDGKQENIKGFKG